MDGGGLEREQRQLVALGVHRLPLLNALPEPPGCGKAQTFPTGELDACRGRVCPECRAGDLVCG